MRRYTVALIKGDGIGPEIVDEAVKVLDAVSVKEDLEITYKEALLGGSAIEMKGTPIPPETIEIAKSADAVLFGAIGGPKWDNLRSAS